MGAFVSPGVTIEGRNISHKGGPQVWIPLAERNTREKLCKGAQFKGHLDPYKGGDEKPTYQGGEKTCLMVGVGKMAHNNGFLS